MNNPGKENSGNAKQSDSSVQANDNECWNCFGINFISEELAKQGKRPTCYGMQFKAVSKISDNSMRKLENLPAVPPNTKIFMFGLSQSSSRMHRRGQIPVMKQGFPVILKYEELVSKTGPIDTTVNKDNLLPPSLKEDRSITSRNSLQDSSSQSLNKQLSVSVSTVTERPKSSGISNSSSSDIFQPTGSSGVFKFAQSVQKSSVKLLADADKIVQHLPNTSLRSLDRLQSAVAKRMTISWHKLSFKLFGSSDNDDPSKRK